MSELLTPTDLASGLPAIVRTLIGRTHTATLARVERYDQAGQVVEVTPLVDDVDDDGRVTTYRRLAGVPVLQPTGYGGGLTLPIAAGDHGLLIFTERATDEAVETGRPGTPRDHRRYHLSDGFFVPGLRLGDHVARAQYTDAVELSCGDVRVTLRDGRVAIGVGGVELLKVLSDALQTLSTTTVLVQGAPVPLSSAAALATLRTQLETIRGVL
jgi:hypothetical protein